IISIKDQVVEVEFTENYPKLHDVLYLEEDEHALMEVISSSAVDRLFCMILSGGDKMCRGAIVKNTASALAIPVGNELLGRVIDIFGNAIDGKEEIKIEKKVAIYRA